MKYPERLNTREEETLKKIEYWMDDDINAMISGGYIVSCATLLSIFIMDFHNHNYCNVSHPNELQFFS